MTPSNQKRIIRGLKGYKIALILSIMTFIGLFNSPINVYADTLKVWNFDGRSVTLNDDYSFTLTGSNVGYCLEIGDTSSSAGGCNINMSTPPYNNFITALGSRQFEIGSYIVIAEYSGQIPNMTPEQRELATFTVTSNLVDTSGIEITTPEQNAITFLDINFSGTYSNTGEYNNILFYLSTEITENGGTYLLPIPQEITTDTPFSKDITFLEGVYYWGARFYNSNTYTFGDWTSNNNNAYVFTATYDGIVYQDCDITAIRCNFENAMVWAFTVPPATFNKITNLKNDISTKAPFGYITSVFDTLGGLNNTSDQVFELETVTPITSLIFTPIRNGLNWVLYFVFIFALFIRFKNINI